MSTFISAYSIIKKGTFKRNGDTVLHSAGSVEVVLENGYNALQPDYPKFYKMDNLCKAGFLAAELLLKHFPVKHFAPESVALVLTNAHASLDTDLRYSKASARVPSPGLFVYTLPNIVAGEISIRHGLKGETAFFITQDFDAESVYDYVEMVMASPNVQACIAGWIDVMGEHHDVFLYLAEKAKRGLAATHSAESLRQFYLM